MENVSRHLYLPNVHLPNIYTDYMIKTDKLWELADFILLEEWQIWYLEKEY